MDRTFRNIPDLSSAVITAAANGARNVKALVYIAALAPAEGESLGEIGSKFPPAPGGQYIAPGRTR